MDAERRRLPGDGIPQSLYELTSHVERRLWTHFRGARLHWGLRRILQQLWLRDGLSQKEIAGAVGSSEASISNMLKHLVDGGWVERRRDTHDYRISRVFLTDGGKALRAAILGELRAIDREVRERLGREEATHLHTLMRQAADALFAAAPLETAERGRELGDRPSPPGEL
ncbi:MAG: MarR family transcriptional regulator [Candidatus Bipolaricaulota bacterium]|nr:MAG: MarR family transcriptional regulator [Candidatus Bipolaricaulota bacterium]